jgi:hypothetical protein
MTLHGSPRCHSDRRELCTVSVLRVRAELPGLARRCSVIPTTALPARSRIAALPRCVAIRPIELRPSHASRDSGSVPSPAVRAAGLAQHLWEAVADATEAVDRYYVHPAIRCDARRSCDRIRVPSSFRVRVAPVARLARPEMAIRQTARTAAPRRCVDRPADPKAATADCASRPAGSRRCIRLDATPTFRDVASPLPVVAPQRSAAERCHAKSTPG